MPDLGTKSFVRIYRISQSITDSVRPYLQKVIYYGNHHGGFAIPLM
jgi:hypothetical protein